MENSNRELFRTKSEFLKKLYSNILFVAVAEYLLYNKGLTLKYIAEAAFDPFASIIGEEFDLYYNHYFWLIVPIILTLVFMRLTCPGALYIFKEGSFRRKLRSACTGLLIGFAIICILNLMAWISGTTVFSYNRFDWHLIPLLPLVFIQCSAEEILLRGYVPAVLGEKHSWDVVCYVSGILFIFHHVLNMEIYGFEARYCLNLFLMGVFFCLMMKWEGNFWVTSGIHTGWNYTQLFVMGTSAGNKSMGIITGKADYNPTFYDEKYGFISAVITTVLFTALILLLIYNLSKRGKLEGYRDE